MNLEGTKTEKNLQTAFAGESMARNKYTYYASVAKKEGYEQIAGVFQATADNEKEHAKMWFKLLGHLKTTPENLKDAADGENYEWTTMYKQFEQEAREEGFGQIADFFSKVAAIEADHEARYKKLLQNIEQNQVFSRKVPQKWVCRNCGHVHEGTEPPTTCPSCAHPQAFFEIKAENY